MTNYGTIPTSSSQDTDEFISAAKPQVKVVGIHNGRPWKEMLRSLNLPSGFRNTIQRMKTNLAYFRANYIIILILILFLSLFLHPVSLPEWLDLVIYVLVVLLLSNCTVMICLLIFISLISLLFTVAAWNIILSISIGAVVVMAHASFRNTDDLSIDEQQVAQPAGIPYARPWKEILRSLNFPSGFRNTVERMKTNIDYFNINYVIILMIILCLSYLCHPVSSTISFALFTDIWLFLYYLHKEPSSMRTVVFVWLIISVIMESFIEAAWINILSTLLIEALVVAAHASFRKTDDLFLVVDEELAHPAGVLTSPPS